MAPASPCRLILSQSDVWNASPFLRDIQAKQALLSSSFGMKPQLPAVPSQWLTCLLSMKTSAACSAESVAHMLTESNARIHPLSQTDCTLRVLLKPTALAGGSQLRVLKACWTLLP